MRSSPSSHFLLPYLETFTLHFQIPSANQIPMKDLSLVIPKSGPRMNNLSYHAGVVRFQSNVVSGKNAAELF